MFGFRAPATLVGAPSGTQKRTSMNKSKSPKLPHIPTLAAELGFACRFRSGYYTLERDGIIVRYSRLGGGSLEVRLRGTLQKAQLRALATRPYDVATWLRKLTKGAACDALRAMELHKLKAAQSAVSNALRDIDELEDEIRIWWERDWDK
jgi:hypothetical protein